MTTHRFALDTNVFIQARPLQELPWKDVTPADTVELVLLRAVLRELDRHKDKGNSRLARRARATHEQLDELFDGAAEVVLRQAKPRVVVRMAPPLPATRAKHADLDLTEPDGRIVEEALAVREVLGEELTFLTNDRLPHLTATGAGLPSLRLPKAWLSPPESDERDKELARVKAELSQWENRAPKLDLQLLVGGVVVDTIEGSLPRCLPSRKMKSRTWSR